MQVQVQPASDPGDSVWGDAAINRTFGEAGDIEDHVCLWLPQGARLHDLLNLVGARCRELVQREPFAVDSLAMHYVTAYRARSLGVHLAGGHQA